MNRRRSRWGGGLALASLAAVAAGCGGGAAAIVALLPYVVPVGGSWTAGEQLADRWQELDGGDETIAPPQETDADYFRTQVASKPATLTSTRLTACGDATKGLNVTFDFDGRDFTLRATADPQRLACLRGRAIDNITLEIDAAGGALRYRNALAFQPRFELGVWHDAAADSRRIRFRADAVTGADQVVQQTGCLFSDTRRTGDVVVRWRQANVATGEDVRIESLVLRPSGQAGQSRTGGTLQGMAALVAGDADALQFIRKDEALDCPPA
jgi:hypothetical protein